VNALVPIGQARSGRVARVNDPKLGQARLPAGRHVFQQYNLFPHKTALDNVMMAPCMS